MGETMKDIRWLIVSLLFLLGLALAWPPDTLCPTCTEASAPSSAYVAAQALPDLGQGFWTLLGALLNNEAATAMLLLWLLSLVPSPLRGAVEALTRYLLEQLRKQAAERAVQAAYVEHRPDRAETPEDKQQRNQDAFAQAVDSVAKTGIPQEAAEEFVRSAFNRLKADGLVR